MKLHERLRELRVERDLRLWEVAERTNISVPYLSDLERGRTNPSLDTLQALAQGYGLTVKAVLAEVEGYGGITPGSLPQGLQSLLADPVLGPQLSPDWIQTLARIEFRGQRPRYKMDWYETYLYLKRILD